MSETIPFTDKRYALFGRADDLKKLRCRANYRGLTVLVGRPQSGKSTLLRELARTLMEDSLLVGYHESKGGAPDNVLRSVRDLYTRWLSDSTYYEQAKTLYRQQSKNAFSGTAGVLAKVFGEAPSITKPVGVMVESAINGLLQAREDFNTGRLIISPLQYDQANELLTLVHEVSGKSLILILDAWEQTVATALDDEQKLLQAFVQNRNDWPQCHIFVAIRPEKPALKYVKKMNREFGNSAEIINLEDMNLLDTAERVKLVKYLHANIPASRSINDNQLITLIGGYAGVIGRWINGIEVPQNTNELQQLAKNAHENCYPELETILDQLADDERSLAIRLALLDNAGIESWSKISKVVLNANSAKSLDHLTRIGLLENANPPTYGHIKRADVAKVFLIQHYPNGICEELRYLVAACADQIVDIDAKSRPFAEALFTIKELQSHFNFTIKHQTTQRLLFAIPKLFGKSIPNDALYGAAESLNGKNLLAMCLYDVLTNTKNKTSLAHRDTLFDELKKLTTNHSDPKILKWFAGVLVTVLNDAKDDNNWSKRDSLLDELRYLAKNNDVSAVRESFAYGLYNTLTHSKDEPDLARREALLNELRELAAKYDEPVIHERLACGLYNSLNYSNDESNLIRRDEHLGELREIVIKHNAPVVREHLANGLLNVLIFSNDQNNLVHRDSILNELKELANKHNDLAIHKALAYGLFNSLNYSINENNYVYRDELLNELRDVAKKHNESKIHETYAKGLLNSINAAKNENNLIRRDSLLDELRDVAIKYDEPGVYEEYAKGLLNSINAAKNENKLDHQQKLLDDLRILVNKNDDPAILKRFAKGLLNIIEAAEDENNLKLRDALLEELRELASKFTESAIHKALATALLYAMHTENNNLSRRDALLDELRELKIKNDVTEVRELLAVALYDFLTFKKDQGDLIRRDALLDEMRNLKENYNDPAIRKYLSMGLFNTLNSIDKANSARQYALLDEIRNLATVYDEPIMRDSLSKALLNTLNTAKKDNDLVRRDALLDELRELAKNHDEAELRRSLAEGLLNTLTVTREENNQVIQNTLAELEKLLKAWPNDFWVVDIRKKLLTAVVVYKNKNY